MIKILHSTGQDLWVTWKLSTLCNDRLLACYICDQDFAFNRAEFIKHMKTQLGNDRLLNFYLCDHDYAFNRAGFMSHMKTQHTRQCWLLACSPCDQNFAFNRAGFMKHMKTQHTRQNWHVFCPISLCLNCDGSWLGQENACCHTSFLFFVNLPGAAQHAILPQWASCFTAAPPIYVSMDYTNQKKEADRFQC